MTFPHVFSDSYVLNHPGRLLPDSKVQKKLPYSASTQQTCLQENALLTSQMPSHAKNEEDQELFIEYSFDTERANSILANQLSSGPLMDTGQGQVVLLLIPLSQHTAQYLFGWMMDG